MSKSVYEPQPKKQAEAPVRRSTRSKLKRLDYIDLPSGNSGIVLDVSLEGLGFQTVHPLELEETLRFRLWVKPIEQIEAVGRVVWIDETGKRGGLQFTELPVEVREQILVWLSESYGADGVHATIVAEGAIRSQLPGTNAPSSSAPATASRPDQGIDLDADVDFETGTEKKAPVFGSSLKVDAERKDTRLSISSFVGTLVILALIASLAFVDRQQAGHFLIVLGQRISGESREARATDVQIERSQVATAPSVGNIPADQSDQAPASTIPASPIAKVKTQPSPAQKTPAASANPAFSADQEKVATVDMDGEADLALAKGYLGPDANPDMVPRAVQLLWSAVEKGNIKAEKMLAEIYLRGQGVPQNCEQGKILLTAASKADPYAKQRLEQIQSYGCTE